MNPELSAKLRELADNIDRPEMSLDVKALFMQFLPLLIQILQMIAGSIALDDEPK